MTVSTPAENLKAIFWDAAGTLMGLSEPVGQTYARFAAQHGIHAESEALNTAFRRAWKANPQPQNEGVPPIDAEKGWWMTLVNQTFERACGRPVPADVFDPLFERLYQHYETADAWFLYPDTLPALNQLKRFRLFVLSNFDHRLLTLLKALQIADYFEGVISSSQAGYAKPHQGIFLAAAKMAGVPPSACLHVGDEAEADVMGATAAGFCSWHVKRPESDLLALAKSLDSRSSSF
jgi:putative hydrolase of the HAD superfamily